MLKFLNKSLSIENFFITLPPKTKANRIINNQKQKETMSKITDRNQQYTTPEAKALVEEWKKNEEQIEEAKKRGKELEAKMVKEICPFKIGQVFVREEDGKKLILSQITPSHYFLTNRRLTFDYAFRALTKSGRPSNGGTTFVRWNEELTPTDEIIEL